MRFQGPIHLHIAVKPLAQGKGTNIHLCTFAIPANMYRIRDEIKIDSITTDRKDELKLIE